MSRPEGHQDQGALAPQTPRAVAPATLLGGSTRTHISVAGRIRAGIQVLTRAAQASDLAREIYDAGLHEGKGFEAIARDISQRVPELKRPLTPKNVPYFSVRGEDFPNPEIARQIMDLYAEDRGDGVRRLYRFAVVFPSDAWQSVMPHQMEAWSSQERRYWSEYSADGRTRRCMTHAPVAVDGAGRKTVRIFGGRKAVPRADNHGVCDPEGCPEYQAHQCSLRGRFIFYVPGIRSLSAFDLPTNSFYALQGAIEKLQTVAFMRGGIGGFLGPDRTSFWLSKRLVEVSRIDDEGRAIRTPQWLIELEAPVDPTALRRGDDGIEVVDERAAEAARRLEGVPTASIDADGVIDMDADRLAKRGSPAPEAEPEAPRSSSRSHPDAQGAASAPSAGARPEPGRSKVAHRPAERAARNEGGGPDVQAVFEAARSLAIEEDRYEVYAAKRFGPGWKLSAHGRKRALDEIQWFGSDAQAFGDKVRGELEVFS